MDEYGERLPAVEGVKHAVYFGQKVGAHGRRMTELRVRSRDNMARYMMLFAPSDAEIPPGTVLYGYGTYPLSDRIVAVSTEDGGFLAQGEIVLERHDICLIEFTNQEAVDRHIWSADGYAWQPL